MLVLAVACIATANPTKAQAIDVYTTRQPFLIKPIADQFTKASGIEVRLVHIKLGMVERLKLEGSLSPADLILTAESGTIQAIDTEGLLAPLTTTGEPEINAPPQYQTNNWIALTKRVRAIIASAEDPNPPLSYNQLTDPRLKGKICMREARHNYNIQLIASMLMERGEPQTTQWLEGLRQNLARKPQGNDRAQIRSVAKHKCSVALANSYYVAKMLTSTNKAEVQAAQKVRVILPNQNSNAQHSDAQYSDTKYKGSYIGVSAAGIAKHSDNRGDAKKFLRFLLSTEGQKLYADLNYEYPIKPNVKVAELVASWGNLTPADVDFRKTSSYRKQALLLVKQTAFDNAN